MSLRGAAPSDGRASKPSGPFTSPLSGRRGMTCYGRHRTRMPGCLRTAGSALRTGSRGLVLTRVAGSVRSCGLLTKHAGRATFSESGAALGGLLSHGFTLAEGRARRCRGDAAVHRRETPGGSATGVEPQAANVFGMSSSSPTRPTGDRRPSNRSSCVLPRRLNRSTSYVILCAVPRSNSHRRICQPLSASGADRAPDIVQAEIW
jgi:hypothetical protein